MLNVISNLFISIQRLCSNIIENCILVSYVRICFANFLHICFVCENVSNGINHFHSIEF